MVSDLPWNKTYEIKIQDTKGSIILRLQNIPIVLMNIYVYVPFGNQQNNIDKSNGRKVRVEEIMRNELRLD